MRQTTPLTLGRTLTVLTLLATPVWAQQQTPPPPSVVVTEARAMSMAPVIQVPGTVISRNDAQIAAEIGGRVTAVADVGAVVEDGGVIAQLDTKLLELQVRQNEATVSRLEANLAFLTGDVKRYEELAQSKNTSERSLEEAEVQRDIAAMQLEEARVALDRARLNLERATVRAPFGGQVVERLVELGEYVNTGAQVVRLVDMANVDVRARIPVRVAPFIEEGQNLTLDGPGRVLSGRVNTLVRVGNEVTRTFEVRLAVPPEQWIIGTAVRVSVPTDEPRGVVAVPRDALVLRQTGTALFKLVEGNAVRRILVDTGAGEGDMIEVRGDVTAGDRVVIRGAERLSDGQTVRIIGTS